MIMSNNGYLEDENELFIELASPISDLIFDKDVTEIYIDRWDNISYEKKGLKHNLHVDGDVNKDRITFANDKEFVSLCNHVITQSKITDKDTGERVNYYSVNTSAGHRISIYIPDNSTSFELYFMTIRLFRAENMSSSRLIELGMLSEDQYAQVKNALVRGSNILISGKPGCGKTTLLRCLLIDILNEFNFRVAFLEDPKELNIEYERGFALEVDHSKPKSAPNALRFFLFSSPDIMIIGELLDSDITLTYSKSIEAGFSGTISTIHSDSASVTIDRLSTLGSEGSDFSRDELLRMCNDTIDMVVHVSFDKRSGFRCVKEILDLQKQRKLKNQIRTQYSNIDIEDLFKYYTIDGDFVVNAVKSGLSFAEINKHFILKRQSDERANLSNN